MSHAKTVLVLGGGIGGIVTATQLRKQLPREHRVILVERETMHAFSPSLPWVMVGMRRVETITRPRTKLVQLGVIAHGQAEVVVNNLVFEITGKGEPKRFDGHGACFIETGDGKAGFGKGDFYAEPLPTMKLYQPGHLMHMGKVAYEKYWLFKWF